MGASWTPLEEQRAIGMRNAGADDAAIAATLGRTVVSVQTRLSLLRARGSIMGSRKAAPWSEDRNALVVRMLDEGSSHAQVARVLGVGVESVRGNVTLLRAEGRLPDPDDEDDVVLVPDGDPLLAALHAERARGRSA